MNKTWLFLVVALCSATAMAESKPAAKIMKPSKALSAENNLQVISRPEILGVWGMEIPRNKSCTEFYNFRGGNEVVVKSDKEWSYGLYDYQPAQGRNDALPNLIIQIKYDNNAKDCSGSQEDQAGEISQYFVKWQSANQIQFCSTEKAEQCFATLRRVLP